MHTQFPRQAGTSGLRLLDQELPHSLYVRSRDPSTTNYPRFNYLRPSAIQITPGNLKDLPGRRKS
jgi:hypothetical protein